MKYKCDNCGKIHDYSDCKPARCPDNDCLGLCYEPHADDCKQPIKDSDYILSDGAAWLEVKNFAIRIFATDGGVFVHIYRNGDEMADAIASAYAFDNETTNEE